MYLPLVPFFPLPHVSAWEICDDYLPATPSPSLPLSPGSTTNKSPRWERGPEETRGTKPQTEPFSPLLCSPKQLCISLRRPGQPSPSWGEGGEGGPCRVCVSGAEITTRRADRSCLCLSPRLGICLALTLPPGPALAWNSSPLLGSLCAKAAPGTFQPASPPTSHPVSVPTPLSAPLQPRKGAWTLLGRSPGVFCEPPASLPGAERSLPRESGEDKSPRSPASSPLPHSPLGTGEGAPSAHPKYMLAERCQQAQYIGDRCKPRSSVRAQGGWGGGIQMCLYPAF